MKFISYFYELYDNGSPVQGTSTKFILYFYELHVIFYEFLKFIDEQV
jgi:hypothetical protein